MTETSYAAAAAELEEILDEIERDDVDIDLLAVRVRRAAELIQICRERIHDTRMQVEEIVASMATDVPSDDDLDADSPEDVTSDV